MKRILLCFLFLLAGLNSFSQPITVNNTTYTVPQLVQNVLFAAPPGGGSSCVGTINNITWSTGTNFGSTNGIGFFQNSNPNFPLTSGVILSTGNAMNAPGPNTTTLGDGTNAWVGDNQLLTYLQSLGIAPATDTSNNATILEFDFTPLTNQMSFDFLFASEEYGTFQCTFSDSFAFFLTNVTAGTPPINLALIPNTTTPISVVTIRDMANNAGCGSANPTYFGNYNGGANAAASATNFNGETVLMTATSSVIPNNVYHIKLVIADRNDNQFDSAVFLGGGSFDIGSADLTSPDFINTSDFTIADGTAICGSSPIHIQAGTIAIPNVTYSWALNNGSPIPGANNFDYTVTQAGIYTVTLTYPGGCQQSDSMIVEYLPSPPLGTPNDLTLCSAPFNLTDNTAIILNGVSNTLSYHHSLFDAQQLASSISNVANYNGTDGEIIYVAVEDDATGCITTTQFMLHVDPTLCSSATPVQPPNLTLCESSFGSGTATFNFTAQTPIVLGTNNPANYTVTYHLTQAAADGDTGAINPISTFVNTSNPQTIYVRMEEIANPLTFGTTSFQLIVNPLPTATISGTTTICSGTNTVITFNGTPNATVTYTVNGGANQTIVLNAAGTNTVTTPNLVANSTYALVSVLNSATTCTRNIVGSAIVTVRALPTATISGTTAVCKNATSPLVTFTAANGTAPYTFTYSINSIVQPTITTVAGSSISISAPTSVSGSFVYSLVSVQSSGVQACSQNQVGSATITVNPLPTTTISGTTTVCSGETAIISLNGIPNAEVTYNIDSNPNQTIILDALGNAMIVTPVLTSLTTYNLVSVLNTNTTCSQLQSGSAVVTVNTAPVITTPTDYVVCDDSYNNDGFYCNFDLSTKINEITGGNANIVVTFHETLTNSQTGANPIASPYCNIDPGLQTIYVRAYTLGSPACYTNTTFNLIVNPLPLANPVISDYELCDYNNPGDEIEIFTLNSKDVEIANGQLNVTISYYDSQANATNQVSPLPNLHPNGSNPEQIWINISNNTTGCSSVSSFNLIVNPVPPAVTPEPLFECSNGATNQAEFDLTINEGVVTNGNVSGLTITYYTNAIAAQNEDPAFQVAPLNYLGTDNEIIYIRVEDNATGCYATTTQLLRVTQGPTAITPQALHYCDPNNDGFGLFNLSDATTEIAGGTWPIPGVSISYYETETDALIGAAPSLTSPYSNINPWTQTIYVRVFYTLTGCANYVQLQLIVDPTPEATEPDDYVQCDYTGAVGYESFDLTTTIPQILGSIDPALNTVSFYTTQDDAENGSNPINNVTNYINQTIWNQTLYVRVETTATGCYDIVSLNLVVNPLPNSTQPNYPQYSLCDVDQTNIGFETFDLASQVAPVLLGQTGMEVTFYPSLTDAQNDTNAISNLQYQNQIIYVQTLGIRITNTTTGCYVISTMDIRVEPLPEPIPPTEPYTICDDNQDGYSCGFDLTTLETDILQGAVYTLSFYETLTDAEIGSPVTAIDTTVLYCNINPFTQTLYVRAVNPLTGCWSVMPIILNVNPSPIAPINLDDIVVCDEDNNPYNAITGIDLTQRTPDVLAQQPATGSYTVSYYTTQQAAIDGISPIIPATNYVTSTGTTIWVRVEDNITGCFNLGNFQIIINTPLQLITPAPLSVCDDDANPNNQYHSFDLTVKDAEITQNLSGYTVTYYPSYALAQAGGPTTITDFTAYTNIFPAVQTLGVVVTSAAGCQSITTLDIRVLPVPTPHTDPPALAPKCDDNNPGDMLEVFDLTTNAAYIANGDPNVTLHYFPTLADAQNNVVANEILTPATALVGGNVFIRVENNRIDYLGNHCAIIVEQPLTVNPLPAVTQPLAPYRMCDDDTDGIAFFDLTNPQLAIAILGATQAPADFTITYYATAAGANPFTNTGETPLAANYQNVTPNSQDIYIRVVNNATGCVNATGILTLAVEEYATATGPQTFASCDDYLDPYDGIYQLDLTQYEAAILNGQDPTIFLISYYHNQADAEAGTNAIPLAEAHAYITAPDTDTIWVKVENTSNTIVPVCYALTTIDITIERYPNPIITTPNDVTTICVDYNTNVVVRPLTLDSGITNAAAYTFEWFEDGSTTPIVGATGPTYTVDTASPTGATRNYTVHVTSNSPLACDTTSASFAVIQSGQAAIPAGTIGYSVTNAFTTYQIITVDIVGYGTYEYSLDDGPRQTSNIFTGVSLGNHVIHVWDTEGGIYSCEELIIQDVQIIDYPHYFTPNGDGIHDTWNIVGLGGQPNAKIYIFDRYGKLLKQISSTGAGWDGTYNGTLLLSDDYWFTVDYIELNIGKQFKAHFSLKR